MACPKIPGHLKERAILDPTFSPDASHALEPDDLHYEVVDHFLKCESVRRFPKDFWTREHAGIIRPLKDQHDQEPHFELLSMMRMYFQMRLAAERK